MQKKIKILFLITQSEMGGAQRFLDNLIRNINKEKYEIQLAAGSGGSWEVFEDLDLTKTKLKYAKRNIDPINDLRVVFEIRKLIKKIRPDVLFLNSSKPSVWGPLAVAGLKPRPKIIYRIGGWSFNDPRPNWERKLWIFLERFFAKHKDEIILNNKYDFAQAQKLKIRPKGDIHIIHNGIDVNKLDFLNEERSRKELGLNNDDKIVGTVANFYKTKGLEYIIPAAKLLPDLKFVIIGDGQDRNKLEKLIKNNNLRDRVILFGRKKDAYKYLKAFDIYLLPSVKEGSPWVILEAMAAKVPIVATNVGAVPEILINNKDGLIIQPKKPRQIAEALEKIKTINTTDNAYNTLIQKFTLSEMILKIEKVIDN